MAGTPARRYSWAPFTPGHTASIKHGAASERRWRPIADALVAEAVEAAPWVDRPAYQPALLAWARAEAACLLIMHWLDERGPIDEEGNPRPAAGNLARWEARAESARSKLGLSPMDHARLLATFASAITGSDDGALDQLKAEGQAIIEARAAELDPGPDSDDEDTP